MSEAEALDHQAIMDLIRGRSAEFRAASPILPASGFNPAPALAAAMKSALAEEIPTGAGTPSDTATPALSETDLTRARQEGWAEGRAAAEATFEAKLAEMRHAAETTARTEISQEMEAQTQSFGDALARLNQISAEHIRELETTMTAAIFVLASERAGQAIDTAPQAFLARIKDVAQKLTEGATPSKIHLHPDDLATLASWRGPEIAKEIGNLVADPDLLRGDLRVDFGPLRLSDLISERARP